MSSYQLVDHLLVIKASLVVSSLFMALYLVVFPCVPS